MRLDIQDESNPMPLPVFSNLRTTKTNQLYNVQGYIIFTCSNLVRFNWKKQNREKTALKSSHFQRLMTFLLLNEFLQFGHFDQTQQSFSFHSLLSLQFKLRAKKQTTVTNLIRNCNSTPAIAKMRMVPICLNDIFQDILPSLSTWQAGNRIN